MADIGATTTRCALVDDKGQELAPEIFENADFNSLTGVLRVYLDHRRASDQPTRADRQQSSLAQAYSCRFTPK